MVANFLIDTGAILAILDQDDHWHAPCLATFLQLRLPALTSEAVLTEVFHLVKRSRTEMETVWKFLRPVPVTLATIDDYELHSIHALMSRYPMDFADATLVYLAARESIETILTVDQTDFSVYRIAGKRRFRVLPIERP
jgi:predicted nucleic acid-binding protein